MSSQDQPAESVNDSLQLPRGALAFPQLQGNTSQNMAVQNRQLLEGLMVAVQQLAEAVNQRLPVTQVPTPAVTVPVPAAPPAPAPDPTAVASATVPARSPRDQSPSVILTSSPNDLQMTFEELGAGPNLFLDTPTVRIPLVRRTSQLTAIPLQWEQDDTAAFQTAQTTPHAPATPAGRASTVTAPAAPAAPAASAAPVVPAAQVAQAPTVAQAAPAAPAAQAPQVAPPPSTAPAIPNAAANHFAGLVSGLNAGNRRLSQTTRAVRGSTDLSANTPTQVVLHPPKHDIELTSLSVNAIIKFVTDVIDYQYRYRIPLQVPSLIRPAIVREIMARHPRLNYASFQALDADQIFQLLQFEMAPSTLYEVINRLDRSVRFKLDDSKYRPSSRDYRPFYSALLTYIREFTMAYDLITGLLPADLIPKLSTKDLGILKVFLSKIPFEYGWRIHTAYLQDNVNTRGPGATSMASNPQSITNFHRYLSAFGQYVNQHFNVYRDCRTFEQFFGGTAYHGGTNTARPRHRTQHVNAIMPAPTLPPEDSSNSEDDSDPEPYPDDMVYPEQEDTLDDGNMYADTADTAFVPAAADSQLSLAEAHSQNDAFADDPGSLNAIPSTTLPRLSDTSQAPSRGSQSPRPPTMPQRKLTGSSGRASSPSTSAHSTVHGYGHRRSSDSRYPATDKRKPHASTSPGTPQHPNTPPWKRPQSPSSQSS